MVDATVFDIGFLEGMVNAMTLVVNERDDK